MTDETTTHSDASFAQRIQDLIDTQISPALASHGGGVEVVKIEDHDVYLELQGGCKGCPGARATMRNGIEMYLRDQVPELGQVIDATDHGA